MKIKHLLLSTAFALGTATTAMASSVDIDLTSILQSISVSNDAASTANITSVVYSLGTAGDGVATWDSGTGGGTASDFLSDPNYFQTVTWSGLSVAAGDSFSASGLDIDKIVTLAPLSVTGSTLFEQNTDPLMTLAGAFVSVFWSDGSSGTTGLNQTPWSVDQRLSISSSTAAVPLPASLPLLLAGLGLFAGFTRRKA